MHGGMKVYRGAPAAARNYLDADRSRADDYYLAEGTGVARRYAAGRDGPMGELAPLTGDGYEAWVAGLDPDSHEPRGRLRTDASAVRFVEVAVNGPKSWSLAAELRHDLAAAYEAAQDRAAEQIIGWLARHATTRMGPRGAQVAVPVERLEAVTVRHYTSRAGDPHRHLHLQVNARVFAAGKWRGIDTVAFRDSIQAVNGIGHAAVMCDPEFRGTLAGHGYTVNPESGEIEPLAGYVGSFSKRAAQIAALLDRYEAEWRREHPNQEPGLGLRRAWDARAWAEDRPDKVVPRSGKELRARWLTELHALGYRDRDRPIQIAPNWPGDSTALPPSPKSSPASAPHARRGTPRTCAAMSNNSSPATASSPSRRCGASWPKTSPPALLRNAFRSRSSPHQSMCARSRPSTCSTWKPT
jgi:exodeoxyribonuclease V alpha subunit